MDSMMKVAWTMLAVTLVVFLSGCAYLQEGPNSGWVGNDANTYTVNITAIPADGLISTSGNENLSVVRIGSKFDNGRWKFPHQSYPGEFTDAGLYSDTFLMLNKSLLMTLDENEAIWLTAGMGNDNQTVLFNAIYSNEVFGCGGASVRILGRDYPISTLHDGSSFGNDDRWKVKLLKNGTCLKRVIIYMDGYFSDLKDGDEISLFRSDNAVLFGFKDIVKKPNIEVIGTRPPQETLINQNTAAINQPIIQNESFSNDTPPSSITNKMIYTIGKENASDMEDQVVYTETETAGPGGLNILFDQPIPMFISNGNGIDYQFDNLKENDLVYIYINNSRWRIVHLRGGNTTISYDAISKWYYVSRNFTQQESEFIIGKETRYDLNQCGNITLGNLTFAIKIGSGKVLFEENFSNCTNLDGAYTNDPLNGSETRTLSYENNLKQINGKWVQLIQASPIDAAFARVNVYDHIVNLTSDPSVVIDWNVQAVTRRIEGCNPVTCWEHNETLQSPEIRSVFIPQASPILKKLAEESNEASLGAEDSTTGEDYQMNLTIGSDGLTIEFENPLKVSSNARQGDENQSYEEWYKENRLRLLENQRANLDINNNRWVITELEKGPDTTKFILGHEVVSTTLSSGFGSNPSNDSAIIDGKNLTFKNVGAGIFPDNSNLYLYNANLTYFDGVKENNFTITEGSIIPFGDGFLKAGEIVPPFAMGTNSVEITFLSEILNLTDPMNNVTIEWVDPDSWENASVKSIFIPRSSPIFEKLTG